jgi:hypothetical protein
VSKIEDPFFFFIVMAGLKIAKGMERSGRGIKVSSISLILYFNFIFSTSIPPMLLSNASRVTLQILEIWEGHIFLRLTFFVGESPCGQVDSLLVFRLLMPRQKVLNIDTDFLLDLIKLMNEREGEIYIPYERHLSLQSLG